MGIADGQSIPDLVRPIDFARRQNDEANATVSTCFFFLSFGFFFEEALVVSRQIWHVNKSVVMTGYSPIIGLIPYLLSLIVSNHFPPSSTPVFPSGDEVNGDLFLTADEWVKNQERDKPFFYLSLSSSQEKHWHWQRLRMTSPPPHQKRNGHQLKKHPIIALLWWRPTSYLASVPSYLPFSRRS